MWPFSRHKHTTSHHTVKTQYKNIFEFLAAEREGALLAAVVAELGTSVHDLFALARVNQTTWAALSGDHTLWRTVYVNTDPLVTPDIRKRMLRDSFTKNLATITCTLPRTGLQQSAWLRSCTLLYTKPRLLLVMGGCDPVIVRRLGQPEQEAVVVNHLGINYHLDSYLDEDMQRFAVEFPQCFQELDFGDLVVTQDFKGAGLWTAVPDPDNAPFMKLRKNGRDSTGFGILGKDQAPPMFPLLYYFDADLETAAGMERRERAKKHLYWFSYTMLPDKSMFSWDSMEVLDAL